MNFLPEQATETETLQTQTVTVSAEDWDDEEETRRYEEETQRLAMIRQQREINSLTMLPTSSVVIKATHCRAALAEFEEVAVITFEAQEYYQKRLYECEDLDYPQNGLREYDPVRPN